MSEIDWSTLFSALALVMVIEGIMPFANPRAMRRMLQTMLEMDDRSLRATGLISMIAGLALLYLVH